MKINRRAALLLCSGFCLLLLSPAAARAQELPRTYLFLEVKDSAGQPLADAEVKASGDDTLGGERVGRFGPQREFKTDKAGVAYDLLHYGSRPPPDILLQVSKPGFLPFEDIYTFRPHPSFGIEGLSDRHQVRLQVWLLKLPSTRPERRAVEREQNRRLLLLAAKRGDAAHVRRLLRAGASARTADTRGVPAVAWAAFTGHPEVIRALLDAGADVRDTSGPAHEALAVYLEVGRWRCRRRAEASRDEDAVARCDKVVRELTRAGARAAAQD